MSRYIFTDRGESIAQDIGLSGVAEKLYESDDNPFLKSMYDEVASVYDGQAEILKEAAVNEAARLLLPRTEEYARFIAGVLSADEQKLWYRVTGAEAAEGRLFTVPQLPKHAKGNRMEDAMVLSGAVGLGLRNRQAVRRVLSKDGFKDFGLESRVSAASFVGAYILDDLTVRTRRRFGSKAATFSYDFGSEHCIVEVGGDFHGDFRIHEVRHAKYGAITPVGTFAEFAPEKVSEAAGYHSVEPNITDKMLETVFLVEGIEGLRQVLDEFTDRFHRFTQLTDAASGPGVLSGFGDYGINGTDYSLLSWLRMFKEDGYSRHNKVGKPGEVEPLLRTLYLPGSEADFEIYGGSDGIYFSNTGGNEEDAIHIRRKHFADLFTALLEQANQGLGRTSPAEHANVLRKCYEILE